MKVKTVVMASLLTVAFSSAIFGAESSFDGNPARIAGYYHSENRDVILLANGTAYIVNKDADKLLDGPEEFSVFSEGDSFIYASDDTYVLFREQKEKGRTENGGVFYAAYLDFSGMEEEIGFHEGNQVRFEGYVFDNDYEVFRRDPLTTFFGVNLGIEATGIIEGNGFATPQEALGAYIEGLKNNDIDQMISTFAVETYVENYSIMKMVERLGSYQPVLGYVPSVSDFSVRLNIEKRRSDIMNSIRNQYLVLQGSPTVIGEDAGKPVVLRGDITAEEVLQELFVSDDIEILGTIEFNDEFFDPTELSGNYGSEINLEFMKKQAAVIGAEDLVSVAAKFYCDGSPVIVTADAVEYNGRWYLNTLSGNIGNLLALNSYIAGTLPLKYDAEGTLSELVGEYGVYELETE